MSMGHYTETRCRPDLLCPCPNVYENDEQGTHCLLTMRQPQKSRQLEEWSENHTVVFFHLTSFYCNQIKGCDDQRGQMAEEVCIVR